MMEEMRHLNMDELLALRDGEGSAGEVAHLEACEVCRAEMERLQNLKVALSALPALSPRRDFWPEIAGAIGRGTRLRWAAVGAVWLAAATLAGVLVLRGPAADEVTPERAAESSRILPAQIERYVDRSAELERLLVTYSPENPVLDARQALAVSVLEERLLVIDEALLGSRVAGVNGPLVVNLWEQRVEALEALVSLQLVQGEVPTDEIEDDNWR